MRGAGWYTLVWFETFSLVRVSNPTSQVIGDKEIEVKIKEEEGMRDTVGML